MKNRSVLSPLLLLAVVALILSVGLGMARYIKNLIGEPLVITINGREYLPKYITYQDKDAYSITENTKAAYSLPENTTAAYQAQNTAISAYAVSDVTMTIHSTYFDNAASQWCIVVGIAENGFSSSKYGNARNITAISFTENEHFKTIGTNAFSGWSSLTTLTIPKSVVAFHPSTNMSALTAYAVEEGNTAYSAQDGVLYSADGTYLYRYPKGKTAPGNFFTVPSDVTEIDAAAFDQNPNLYAIIVNDALPYMEKANWGAASYTIAIHDKLGVNISAITYSGGTHTVTMANAPDNGNAITQTGVKGVVFDTIDAGNQFTLQSNAYGSGKWLTLDNGATYAYAVLDSDNVLHIYNNNSPIPAVDAPFGDGLTVKGVYKPPSNIPGTKELTTVSETWRVLGTSASTVTGVIVEDPIAPSTLSSWFREFRVCTSFDLKKLDTSRATAMDQMFHYCYKITSLDLLHFETEHVTTMANMFSNCSELTVLDLSSFSNESLKSIGSMFSSGKLETVYVGEKWLPKSNMSGQPFSGIITGSKGTIYTSGANTATHARIDYDEGLPGYLTYKGSPLVRMAIDGIDIKSVAPTESGAVITFNKKPGNVVRIVSSLRDVTDTYLAVRENNGEYQINLPAKYYTDDQLVSVLNVGTMLFACLENDGTLRVYLREIGIDSESGTISFADGETEKTYPASRVFSTPITVDGVQNIGQPLWTNASADIKRLVFADEVTPKSSAASMFANLTACVEFDLRNLNFSNITTVNGMFQSCKAMTSITWAEDINTAKLTNMSQMFRECSAMTANLLPENWNMTNVTTLEKLYYGCTSLETLTMHDSFDTSKVSTMQDMFYNCKSLKNIVWSASFNTSNVTRMDQMFAYCETMETLTLPATFHTEKVASMGTMFGYCYQLKNLDFAAGTFNTSKVSSMGGMFRACKQLTEEDFYEIFSHFTETTSLTNVGAIFNSCTGLKNFVWPAVLNTEKVDYMREVFQYADNLETVDLTNMDTHHVTNTQQFFNGCKALTVIIVDDSWNMDQVTNSINMFSGCNSLIGGNGTTLADIAMSDPRNARTHKYALIDGVDGQPGYLTAATHEHIVDSNREDYVDDRVHGKYCSVYGEPFDTENHNYESGVCTVCGHECTHSALTNCVKDSTPVNGHTGTCTFCGEAAVHEEHTYDGGGKCTYCKYECSHDGIVWKELDANYHNGFCEICEATPSKSHTYVDGECVCGKSKS